MVSVICFESIVEPSVGISRYLDSGTEDLRDCRKLWMSDSRYRTQCGDRVTHGMPIRRTRHFSIVAGLNCNRLLKVFVSTKLSIVTIVALSFVVKSEFLVSSDSSARTFVQADPVTGSDHETACGLPAVPWVSQYVGMVLS